MINKRSLGCSESTADSGRAELSVGKFCKKEEIHWPEREHISGFLEFGGGKDRKRHEHILQKVDHNAAQGGSMQVLDIFPGTYLY